MIWKSRGPRRAVSREQAGPGTPPGVVRLLSMLDGQGQAGRVLCSRSRVSRGNVLTRTRALPAPSTRNSPRSTTLVRAIVRGFRVQSEVMPGHFLFTCDGSLLSRRRISSRNIPLITHFARARQPHRNFSTPLHACPILPNLIACNVPEALTGNTGKEP